MHSAKFYIFIIVLQEEEIMFVQNEVLDSLSLLTAIHVYIFAQNIILFHMLTNQHPFSPTPRKTGILAAALYIYVCCLLFVCLCVVDIFVLQTF